MPSVFDDYIKPKSVFLRESFSSVRDSLICLYFEWTSALSIFIEKMVILGI